MRVRIIKLIPYYPQLVKGATHPVNPYWQKEWADRDDPGGVWVDTGDGTATRKAWLLDGEYEVVEKWQRQEQTPKAKKVLPFEQNERLF